MTAGTRTDSAWAVKPRPAKEPEDGHEAND